MPPILPLKLDPTADGLKQVIPKAAGYNLVLTAERPTLNPHVDKRSFNCSGVGTPSAVKRAKSHKLMDLAYTYTRDEEVIPKQRLIAELLCD